MAAKSHTLKTMGMPSPYETVTKQLEIWRGDMNKHPGIGLLATWQHADYSCSISRCPYEFVYVCRISGLLSTHVDYNCGTKFGHHARTRETASLLPPPPSPPSPSLDTLDSTTTTTTLETKPHVALPPLNSNLQIGAFYSIKEDINKEVKLPEDQMLQRERGVVTFHCNWNTHFIPSQHTSPMCTSISWMGEHLDNNNNPHYVTFDEAKKEVECIADQLLMRNKIYSAANRK